MQRLTGPPGAKLQSARTRQAGLRWGRPCPGQGAPEKAAGGAANRSQPPGPACRGARKRLSGLGFSMGCWRAGVLTYRFHPEIMALILGLWAVMTMSLSVHFPSFA